VPNQIKGYYPQWKPHEKTLVLLGQVEEIFETYRDQLPLTLRQVFYILVANYRYEKTEKAYKRLGGHLNMARRAGVVPFEYLRDDSLHGYFGGDYEGEDEFWADIERRAKGFTLDKLTNQDYKIRIHCEAVGMLPQLRRVCRPFSIPVYSCSGFDSLSVKYDLRREIVETKNYEGKSTVILHLGDCDPSGASIFKDGMTDDVLAFLEEDFSNLPYWDPNKVAIFQRVAMLPEQAELLGVPSAPPKKTDSRSKKWGDAPTYQLEAMPPDVLAEYLETAIGGWLDLHQFEEDQETEVEKRAEILNKLRQLPAGD
jgi:hypothetical protein